MFCLHREGSSVSRENEAVFWASDWTTTRHTIRVADTAREAAVNCGWLLQRLSRFPPATHHRATLSLRLSPSPSSPHIGRYCLHLLESLCYHPDPLSLSLFLSLCQWIPPSSLSSSYFHHPRGERWFFIGQRQRTFRHLREVESESNSLKSRRQISDQISWYCDIQHRYCDYQLFQEYPYQSIKGLLNDQLYNMRYISTVYKIYSICKIFYQNFNIILI